MINVLFVGKTPYYRHPDFGKYLTPEEPKLCTVTIHWYSLRDGGIGFPRFRIYNHMIFPICFVDRKGQPVTQTGCVRLCKRWSIFFKGAKLRLITDMIDPHKIREGMKFYIFNQGIRMGEVIWIKYFSPILSVSSAAVPQKAIFPLFKITRRSHKSSTSAMS